MVERRLTAEAGAWTYVAQNERPHFPLACNPYAGSIQRVLPVALEDRLLDLVAETYWSSELWVDSMSPWGEPGTFLEKWDGPDEWQRKALQTIDQQLAKIAEGGVEGDLGNTIRMAVSSGHGVGKTALISWIIQWFMATRPNPQVVATAGTQNQLKTKTWREVKKW